MIKIMKNSTLLLLSIIVFTLCFISCGEDKEIKPIPRKKEEPKERPPEVSTDGTVPVVIHIARDNTGNNARATETEVRNMLRDMNADFLPTNIVFKLHEIRYFNDNRFHTSWDEDVVSEEQLVSALDFAKHKINLVILHIDDKYGHANFPADLLDLIEINYEALGTSTPTHEMGHYFSLLHPYSTSRGKELVNGSNSAVTGDLISDTPASPGGNDFDRHTCEYTGNEKDSNGDSYRPDGRNFMSDAPTGCRDRFSPMQIIRMKVAMKLDRYYLISLTNPTIASPISEFPHNDSFDRTENDSWMVDPKKDFGWSFGSMTKSKLTGANSAQNGYYFRFLEASDYPADSEAGLISPCYNLSGKSSANITFHYNMYGRGIGQLKLQVSTDNGNKWTTLFNKSGQQHTSGDDWTEQTVSLNAYVDKTIQLRFLGSILRSSKGDISIDNVTVNAQ
jgi:hypothetical protein